MSELYYNGTILTMDDSCPRVEAVLVEDGTIKKRGTKEEVLACKKEDTVLVDLAGKTMMPGFIDGHSHFTGFAASLSQCDLSQASDFAEIIQLMRNFIEKNQIPDEQWVIGTNYDHNFLKEKRHPDKTVLDAVSKRHPVVLVHASSHMGVANTKALEVQGLGADTPDPAGGRYGRMQQGNALDGYMEENAFVQFRQKMPMADLHTIMQLCRAAQDIYAGYGITTVQEGMVTAELFPILQYAAKNHILYLDLVGYMDLENSADILRKNTEYTRAYQNHFRIGGYKIFLDGSPQGRTAWMQEPYAGAEDGYCGYPIKTDARLYQLILEALKDGQQLLAHCNGDAAAEQYLTQFEKVTEENPEYPTNRPVMIHAQLVGKKQLRRMKPLGMMPSFFVAHTYYWGDIHIHNFGMERASEISPAGTACREGIPFTFHQDSPVLPPDMFQTVWCAVKRVTKAGVELSKEERVDVYDALKANTVYAAYQYGEETKKGTIAEGKQADLIVLNQNPLEVPLDAIKDIKVMLTLKDGVAVYRREA